MRAEQFRVHVEMEQEHWWFLGRRFIMRELARRVLPPSRKHLVVDVGCGTGGNIASLRDWYRCVGIDPSEEALQCARERFPGVRFICGSAPEGVESLLGEARLVLLMDVLEHVPDDSTLLARLLEATRPGAHLLVTVPALNSLWSDHDVSFGHYRRYEMDQLVQLWAALPVTVRLISYFNARLYPPIALARAVNRALGRTSGIEGTDFRIPWKPINQTLKRILGGEAALLAKLMDGKRQRGYARGASLVAVLRREEKLHAG